MATETVKMEIETRVVRIVGGLGYINNTGTVVGFDDPSCRVQVLWDARGSIKAKKTWINIMAIAGLLEQRNPAPLPRRPSTGT